MAEINSIFDYIFPRKKASDYQQTNLLDYGESPESQNVYNPGQGDFGVMSLEGLKNSIPASLAGTLDTGIQLGQYLRQGKEPVRQINENVEPEDFNIYNQYQSTETRPFTKAFQDAGIINTDEEIKAFRERSMGYDTGNLLGQVAGQGMAFKTLTGNAFRDWINFAVPFANIDPISEPNMAQIAQELGADNDFINYMAGNVDENSDAEAILAQKIKNIGSESLLNIPIDGAISLIRSMKSSLPQFKQYIQDSEYRGLVNQDIKEKTTDAFVDTFAPNQDPISSIRGLFGQTDNQFGMAINNQNLPWSLSSTGEGDFYIKRHGANAGTPSKERTSPNDIAVKVDQNVLLPDYAYYLFQYLQPKMASRAHGSVQQAINFRDVNDTLVEHLTGQSKTVGSELFGGVKSQGADRSLLNIAKARYETDGLDDFNNPRAYNGRQQVWRDTGWAKGRDGKWYYEMDDSQAQIAPNVINDIGKLDAKGKKAYAPSNFLEHPELWKHYPDIDNEGTVHVLPGVLDKVTGKIVFKGGASAMTIGKDVYVPHYKGATAPDIKDTILHEYQHLIQERERFMQGGDQSQGFILKLRDQLYSEMKSQAKDPGMFGFVVNLKRLHDAQQLQPTYQKITELLSADDVEGALNMLRKTPWWQKEGGLWRKKVDYQYNMWERANPNATELEKDDVLRTIKKMNLRGQGEYDKARGLPPTEMAVVTDSYNKEITALKKKLAKDLKTDEEGVDQYMLDTQGEFAKKGYNTPQLFGRALDDLILQKFDPQGRKAISDYRNKFKMIRNVEDGVYNDYQSRNRVYKSLMGESQARNVEWRMDMSAEKRRDIFPEETEEFGSFQETRIRDGMPIDTLSDNQPIFVDRPDILSRRKGKGEFNALKLIDELEQTRELAPVDEGGYFMKSAQVVMDDPREVYKQPGLLAQINKKGELTGELLNKGVTKDEIEETGLLNYLNKKQEAGESVTKQELLDFIQENRPEIAPYTGFKSGSNVMTPNVVIDTPNLFDYDPNTGTFRSPNVENANFKIIEYDDDSVFSRTGRDVEFLEDIITNPSKYGSRALDRRPNLIMRVVDNLEGFTPEQKVQISNSLRINVSPRNLEAVADEMNVPYKNFVENFQNSIKKTAKQNYYKNPQYEWNVPFENDNGVIANYKIRGSLGNEELDQSPYFYLSVERDGNISDLGEVQSLNEARVQIQDSIRSYNYTGETASTANSGIGTNWSEYVQGNTDLDSYREIAVKMPKYGGSDISFHSMAGLPSDETKNMLGHLRIDNRIDLQGRKHTHSMEHQSDLSQKAREFGITNEDFDRKLMNAYKSHDKALDNRRAINKIIFDGEQKAFKVANETKPEESIGVMPDGLHPGFDGTEITKPMMDNYINRLKKFVIDEGLDDEIGMYIVSKRDGTPEKRILKKENFVKNATETLYESGDIPTLNNNSPKEVIERFKNGNPTTVDLQIADKAGYDIQVFFNDKVNFGGANQDKKDIYTTVMGANEPYKTVGNKNYNMLSLNYGIHKKILRDARHKKNRIIQEYAESKGVKGSFLDLKNKINEDVENTRKRKNKLTNRGKGIGGEQPPLINKDRHTKVLLKELIKQGIKDGSDVVSWTPAINQIELWGEGTTSMMKKLYDKDSLEFGNQILKELGLDQKVQTKGATIDYGTMKTYAGDTVKQGERDVMYIELTPELKKAVMNEAPDASDFKPTHEAQSDKAFRQPLYAVPPIGLIGMPNEDNGRIDTNKGLLQ